MGIDAAGAGALAVRIRIMDLVGELLALALALTEAICIYRCCSSGEECGDIGNTRICPDRDVIAREGIGIGPGWRRKRKRRRKRRKKSRRSKRGCCCIGNSDVSASWGIDESSGCSR